MLSFTVRFISEFRFYLCCIAYTLRANKNCLTYLLTYVQFSHHNAFAPLLICSLTSWRQEI